MGLKLNELLQGVLRKMTWNYRIIEFTGEDGSRWWEVSEVYYEGDRPWAYCDATVGCEPDEGETIEDQLEMMKEAIGKPVLKEEDFRKNPPKQAGQLLRGE